MTVAIIAFLYRKPGLSMEQYIDYYETKHMAVIREVAGDAFPLSHTRHYTFRTEDGSSTQAGGPNNSTTPATVFRGEQAVVDHDCVAEIVFENEAEFQKFFVALSSPEGAKQIYDDEINFQQPEKTTVYMRREARVTMK